MGIFNCGEEICLGISTENGDRGKSGEKVNYEISVIMPNTYQDKNIMQNHLTSVNLKLL